MHSVLTWNQRPSRVALMNKDIKDFVFGLVLTLWSVTSAVMIREGRMTTFMGIILLLWVGRVAYLKFDK